MRAEGRDTIQDALAHPVPPRVVTVIAAALLLVQFFVVPFFYQLPDSVAGLSNDFGPSAAAVMKTGSLWVCDGPGEPPTCAFAERMPLMPYFYAGAAALLGDHLIRIAILKTALLDLVLLYFLDRFLAVVGADRLTLLILAAVLAGPQFMLHSFSPNYEEGFLTQLTPVLLIIQLAYAMGRERDFPAWARLPAYAIVSAVVYLVKSSMILVTAWSILFVTAFMPARPRVRAMTVAALCLPPLLWGAVVFHETGHFRVGSSIDGFNLLSGNSAIALDYYPRYSDDLEFGDGPLEIDGRTLPRLRYGDFAPSGPTGRSDEWRKDDALRDAAVRWEAAHVSEEMRLAGRKLWVFFFEIRNTPVVTGYFKPPSLERDMGSAWMAVMRVVLWAAILAAVQFTRARKRERTAAIAFLAFLACYAAPYIVGYGYERHVVPILLPSALFLVYAWRLRSAPGAT